MARFAEHIIQKLGKGEKPQKETDDQRGIDEQNRGIGFPEGKADAVHEGFKPSERHEHGGGAQSGDDLRDADDIPDGKAQEHLPPFDGRKDVRRRFGRVGSVGY